MVQSGEQIEVLMKQALNGDMGAYGDLVERYADMVYRMAFSRAQSHDQVQAKKYNQLVPVKIEDIQSVSKWIDPIKLKKSEGGSFLKVLGVTLLILVIFFLGILFLSDKKKPSEFAAPSKIEIIESNEPLNLNSPFTQRNISWREHILNEYEENGKWIVGGEILARSRVINVNDTEGSKVRLTIEDIQLSRRNDAQREAALNMKGREFEYQVGPDGKLIASSIAGNEPLQGNEISFFANVMWGSDLTGVYQKKVMTPGDQWTDEGVFRFPGFSNSFVKASGTYQFDGYELHDNVKYGVIRSHTTGRIGGGFLIQKLVEPKITTEIQLDGMSFEGNAEFHVDASSGRLLNGKSETRQSDMEVTTTTLIKGRRVPLVKKETLPLSQLSRISFKIEYLP